MAPPGAFRRRMWPAAQPQALGAFKRLGELMTTIAQPSVQSLFIQMQFNGQALATGTSFVCPSKAGPVLLTNRHNVTGRHQETDEPLSKTGGIPNDLLILHNRKDRLGQWVGRVEPLLKGVSPLSTEHPKLGTKADFVALPLTSSG